MEHLFIINPKSFFPNFRKMDLFISGIKDFFREKEEPCTIHISRFPRDAIIIIRRYFKKADSGARIRVYAVGGDGVAFCCLNGIIGIPNAELALMPFGTSNNFVRAFGPGRYDDFRNIGLQAGDANKIASELEQVSAGDKMDAALAEILRLVASLDYDEAVEKIAPFHLSGA
jgi:diacylglycerol kinase family enzyme